MRGLLRMSPRTSFREQAYVATLQKMMLLPPDQGFSRCHYLLTCVVAEDDCKGSFKHAPYMSMSLMGMLLPKNRPFPASRSGPEEKTFLVAYSASTHADMHFCDITRLYFTCSTMHLTLDIVQLQERFRFGEGTGVRKYLAAEIARGHEPHEALSTWAADSVPQQSAELLPHQAQPTGLHKKSLLTFAGIPTHTKGCHACRVLNEPFNPGKDA